MSRRAYSYARFSTAVQADGFSLERQLQAAETYCQRNGLTLEERSFVDKGVSGFHGTNAIAGELGEFLTLVRSGRISKGSVLIVENTDRISRLPPDDANRLITEIVRAGVDVVTTSPEQVYTSANIDKLATWLPLQISNCLAREESEKKAARLKDAWSRKREALLKGKPMSHKGPFWLQWNKETKQWQVKEREAELMRKVFNWCVQGEGAQRICQRLHAEYPDGITGKGWQPNNVRKLIRSRAVIGEFQAHTRNYVGEKGKKVQVKRDAVGNAVKGYYPAIVDETTFYRAQQALDGRKKGGGRATGTPNLFNGILTNASDGQSMVINGDGKKRVLVSMGAIRKMAGSEFVSVPYDVFETAILSRLRELKTADVIGTQEPKEDAVELWSGKLTAINHRIQQTQQRVASADDPSVFLDLLEQLGKERKGIIGNLEAAKTERSGSASDALGDCLSLIDLLRQSTGEEREELRSRLKGALRSLIEGMYMVIVSVGIYKLLDVQIVFRTGAMRHYTIIYRQGHMSVKGVKTEEKTWTGSLNTEEQVKTGLVQLDIRDTTNAQLVMGTLKNYPKDMIEKLLRQSK